MHYRQLGRSSLKVSEIALGSWLTFGGGVEEEKTAACVKRAFELGINFIDTANIYGVGAAETVLGRVLSSYKRSSYVLATKLFFPMSPTDRGLSAAQIRKQLDASLQRLQTDYVDLYQCHRYDNDTPLEETMLAMTDAVRSGKARHIGFSEWNESQIFAAQKIPNCEPFVSSQPQYSMLWRKPEAEVIPFCEASGISQIVWSPMAQGVLSGKYKPGAPPPPDSRAASPVMKVHMNDQGLKLDDPKLLTSVQNLKPIAQAAGLSMPQLALAWVLRKPSVASAIVGISRPEQLNDNAGATDKTLDADTLGAIDRVLAGVVAR
jgi:aryl-alcohol dehydrogenase-like predicted oxidoreductase